MNYTAAVAAPILVICLAALCFRSSSVELRSDHFKDKAVLICDAHSGIGEQLAYDLAAQGAKLFLVNRPGRSESLLYNLRDGKMASPQAQTQISARTWKLLEKVRDKARTMGSPQVEALSFDFANISGIHVIIEEAVSSLGGLDYLVLNHAEVPRGSILQLRHHQTPHFIDRSFKVNVFSSIELALRAMPHLERSKGHIFVSSSMLGEVPDSELPVFSATKHALNGFFYSLQEDLAARKSLVTVSVGSLGQIMVDDKVPLFKIPQWMNGNIQDCARSIMSSLASHPKTLTYPTAHPFITRFMWHLFSG